MSGSVNGHDHSDITQEPTLDSLDASDPNYAALIRDLIEKEYYAQWDGNPPYIPGQPLVLPASVRAASVAWSAQSGVDPILAPDFLAQPESRAIVSPMLAPAGEHGDPPASAASPSQTDLRFDRAAAESRLAARLASLPVVLQVPADALGISGPPVQLDPRVAEQLAASDSEYAPVFAAALKEQ